MRTYDPFREMETLRREIDRAFSNVITGTSSSQSPIAFLPGRAARAYPLLNLSEDKENLYIEALAPGLDPQTLNLTIVRNNLTISGEKSAPQGVSNEAYHRSERAWGKFTRSVDLPVEVDSNRVQARYQDGLLQIALPKAEEAKPKQITVAVS
jgi:HSP20 family protein